MRRRLLWVAGTVGLLWAAAVGVLHLEPVKRALWDRIRSEARSQYGILVSGSNFGYSLSRVSFEIEELTLSIGDDAEPWIFTADRLMVNLALWESLFGTPTIENAVIEGAGIAVPALESADDRTSPAASSDAFALPVQITNLRVQGDALRMGNAQSPVRLAINGWELGIRGNQTSHLIEIETGPGQIAVGAFDLDLMELNSTLDLSGDGNLGIDSFEAVSTAGSLSVTGSVSNMADPVFDLEAVMSANLDVLPPDAAGGRVRAEAAVRSETGQTVVDGRVSGDAVRLGPFVGLTLDGRVLWDTAGQRLGVSELVIEGPVGRLDVDATVSLGAPDDPSQVALEFSDLDLPAIADTLELPVRIASSASGRFTGSWLGSNWQSIVGSGAVSLAARSGLASAHTLPVGGDVAFDWTEGRLSIQTASLRAGPAVVRAEAELDRNGRLEGALHGATRDVFQVAEFVAAFNGARIEPESRLTYPAGAAETDVTVTGRWDDPAIAFSFDAPMLSFRGFSNLAAAGTGRYRYGTVALDSLVVESNQQRLTANGDIDLGTSPVGVALQTTGAGISAQAVLAGLNMMDVPVDGRFDFEAGVGGSLADPQVTAVLIGSGLDAYGVALGRLDAALNWNGDALEIRDFRLVRSEDGSLSGAMTGDFVYRLGAEELFFHLEGSGLEIGELLPESVEPLLGTASFVADGDGPTADLRGQIRLHVENGVYGGVGLGTIELEGVAANGVLDLTAALPEYALRASANIGLDGGLATTVDLSTSGFDIAAIQALLPEGIQPASGVLPASFQGAGELRQWRDGNFRLEVGETAMNLGGNAVSTVGNTVLEYRDRRLVIEPSVFVIVGQRLTVNGDLPVEAEARPGLVRVEGRLDLAALSTLLPASELDLRGVTEGSLTIEGSLGAFRPVLDARVRNGYLVTPNLPGAFTRIDADIGASDDALTVTTLTADWNGARIRASGLLPLAMVSDALAEPAQPPAAARFEAAVEGLDLASIPGLPGNIEGRTDVRLNVEASGPSLEAIEGQLVFESLRGSFEALEVEQENPLTVSIAGGRVVVEPFRLRGSRTELSGDGEFGLRPADPLRLDVAGNTVTAGLLTSLGIETSGNLGFDLRVRGTVASPELAGEIRLQDGTLTVADPDVQVSDLDALVTLSANTLTLESTSSTVNGGTLDAAGTLTYRGDAIVEGQIDLRAVEVFTEVPEGLTALSSLDISVGVFEDGGIGISGDVRVLEGEYSRDVDLGALLVEYVGSEDTELFAEPDPTLSRIRYDVTIDTVEPLVIDNNLAQAEADVNLQLVGSYYRPGLLGRLVLREGGTIRIRDTQFVLDAGTVDFTSPNGIEPSLNVVARTRYQNHDITVRLNGGGESLATTLTSDPPLSEPNIVSLLLTGRTLAEVEGEGLNVAREQALSYVTGAISGRVARQAEETLGLSRVRIEPNLIANESNPGARLTVGQELTPDLELIYSMNLSDSKDQIWVGEYSLRPRLLMRGVIEEDDAYRFEARHDVTFGEAPSLASTEATATAARTVGSVEIDPETFEGKDLASIFGVRPGRRYDSFEVRRGTERLRSFLTGRDYLESRVHLVRRTSDAVENLTIEVDPGPRVQFDFGDLDVSGRVREAARRAWRDNGFDELRVRRAVAGIQSALAADGYLGTTIGYATSEDEGSKTVRFDVERPPRYSQIDLEFEGVRAFETSQLRSDLRAAGLWEVVRTEPERVREFIELRYRGQGYHGVAVAPLRYELRPEQGRARLVVVVDEGPEYRFSEVRFEGNTRFSEAQLGESFPLAGETASFDRLDEVERGIEELYWREGYNDLAIERTLTPGSRSDEIDVKFSIRENQPGYVDEIDVAGDRNTSERFVRQQITFKPGEPLSFEALNETRRRLYDTRAYSLVQFETTPIQSPPGQALGQGNPVRVRLNLEEVPAYALRYGGSYDTEGGPGVVADFRRQNLWGGARVLGVSGRYDGTEYEVRGNYSQPSVAGLPLETNVSLFVNEEVDGVQTTNRYGVELGQQWGFANPFLLSYGFRYEKARTVRIEDTSALPIDERTNLAPFNITLSRDTRDSFLDATRGSFTSHSLAYASTRLGSNSGYLRYFGQLYRYFPLSGPRPVPLSGGQLKPAWVYAVGARLGLVAGLGGDEVALSEKFFSGGGTSVRGFEQDRLGPLDPAGEPLGGDAVFTFNNEIRFPVFSIVEGVGFLDAGNVYPTVKTIDLTNLRASTGIGLRLRTPYFLLRADYGFKLDRREGERLGAFFFSIGQAF